MCMHTRNEVVQHERERERVREGGREGGREGESRIPGVMEAPAAIYMLSAISTSEIFSTNSVKACTSSNDISSYGVMRETVDSECLYNLARIFFQVCF